MKCSITNIERGEYNLAWLYLIRLFLKQKLIIQTIEEQSEMLTELGEKRVFLLILSNYKNQMNSRISA